MTSLGEEQAAEKARLLIRELEQQQIEAVNFCYLDNSGVARTKGVPVARLAEAAQWGVGMSPCFDAFMLDDSSTSSASAGGPMGDIRLLPDLDSLSILVAEPGWAWVPVARWAHSGEPHRQCQRSLVERMMAAAAAKNLQFQMAFEVEWMVSVAEGDDYIPATRGPAYGSIRMTELSAHTAELLTALRQQGIEVQQLHPEYSQGQFEISVAHSDPLRAADCNMLVRRTIRGVGLKHGLRSSFAPVVVEGEVGNGSHLHLSLWRDGVNLFAGAEGPRGMSAEGEALLAGILRDMPALLAVGAPSVTSYLRLQPQRWTGDFQCWGLENREAALRFVRGPERTNSWSANVEVKCIDATASPYLVVAAVIALGLAGIEEGLALPAELLVDPATLSAEQRQAQHIRRLPKDLQESVTAFERCSILQDAFGQSLFETLIAIRAAEQAIFADASASDIIAATRWQF